MCDCWSARAELPPVPTGMAAAALLWGTAPQGYTPNTRTLKNLHPNNISSTVNTGNRFKLFQHFVIILYFFRTASVIKSLRVFLILGKSSQAVYFVHEYNPAVSTITFGAPKAVAYKYNPYT